MKLVCAKDGCQEDMTTMSFNEIMLHDADVHGDDFLRGCLTRPLPELPVDILRRLKENPGMVYIPDEKNAMYAHYGDDIMFCFVANFEDMDDVAVNQYLQTALRKVQDEARDD